MATSFVNVNQGVMNPLQVAQSLNEAQKGIRESTDWGNAQLLKNLYSGSLNSDGSLRQSEFLSKAAKAGVGPSAVSAWLETQNKTNEAAQKQTMSNAVQKLYGLKPEELRDRNQLPAAQGAGSTSQQGQAGASAFIPKATTGVKAETAKDTGAQGKGESEDSGTQSEGMFSKIVSGVKSAFGANEPEATKASYSYLTPTEKYESDKPLTESASGIVGNAPDNRVITGYDDNFQPIYANDSGYKVDNQGMLTSNSSGALGSNVDVKTNEGALQGQGFTAVAPSADNGYRPQPAPQQAPAPQQQAQAPRQDGRSILERLADSGTGMPQSSANQGTGVIENPIQFAKLNPNVQGMIATQLLRKGILGTNAKPEDVQKVLDADLNRYVEAKAGPAPTPMQFVKEGQLDIGAYATAERAWNQNRQGALKEYTDAAGKMWGETQTQDIAQAGNRRAEIAQGQASTVFGQTQDVIKDAQSRGYARVKDRQQAEQALEASKEVNRLDLIVHDGNQLADDIATGKLSPEEVASRWEVVKNGLASIDGATTGEMRNAIGADPILRRDKSFQEILHTTEDPRLLITNLMRSDLSKMHPQTYSQLIKVMLKQANESSKARAEDRYWRGIEVEKKSGPEAFAPGAGTGTKQDPIAYTRGMKTYKGKFYNVGGMVVEGKN